jgi:signal transduction histidine kinase
LPEHSVPQGRGAAVLTVAAGGLGLAAIALTAGLLDGWLPPAFERLPTSAEEITAADEHPALLIVELLTAAGFGVAAWRQALLADAEGDELSRWMAVGLGLAAIAYVNYALVPSEYTELLYVGDLFFLLAIAFLLWGAIMEITSTEAALVRWAVSSERTRVADELRAGLAQELAFMASQTELFARRPDRRLPLDELAASVERALDESRGAIAELVRPVDEPVAVAVAEAAREAAAGVGASVELDLAGDVEVDRASRDALVRLTRECVIEATRGRGARSLTVQLRGGRRVTLRVIDDGRPAAPGALARQALAERAEAIGARLTSSPAPGNGMVVEVELR